MDVYVLFWVYFGVSEIARGILGQSVSSTYISFVSSQDGQHTTMADTYTVGASKQPLHTSSMSSQTTDIISSTLRIGMTMSTEEHYSQSVTKSTDFVTEHSIISDYLRTTFSDLLLDSSSSSRSGFASDVSSSFTTTTTYDSLSSTLFNTNAYSTLNIKDSVDKTTDSTLISGHTYSNSGNDIRPTKTLDNLPSIATNTLATLRVNSEMLTTQTDTMTVGRLETKRVDLDMTSLVSPSFQEQSSFDNTQPTFSSTMDITNVFVSSEMTERSISLETTGAQYEYSSSYSSGTGNVERLSTMSSVFGYSDIPSQFDSISTNSLLISTSALSSITPSFESGTSSLVTSNEGYNSLESAPIEVSASSSLIFTDESVQPSSNGMTSTTSIQQEDEPSVFVTSLSDLQDSESLSSMTYTPYSTMLSSELLIQSMNPIHSKTATPSMMSQGLSVGSDSPTSRLDGPSSIKSSNLFSVSSSSSLSFVELSMTQSGDTFYDISLLDASTHIPYKHSVSQTDTFPETSVTGELESSSSYSFNMQSSPTVLTTKPFFTITANTLAYTSTFLMEPTPTSEIISDLVTESMESNYSHVTMSLSLSEYGITSSFFRTSYSIPDTTTIPISISIVNPSSTVVPSLYSSIVGSQSSFQDSHLSEKTSFTQLSSVVSHVSDESIFPSGVSVTSEAMVTKSNEFSDLLTSNTLLGSTDMFMQSSSHIASSIVMNIDTQFTDFVESITLTSTSSGTFIVSSELSILESSTRISIDHTISQSFPTNSTTEALTATHLNPSMVVTSFRTSASFLGSKEMSSSSFAEASPISNTLSFTLTSNSVPHISSTVSRSVSLGDVSESLQTFGTSSILNSLYTSSSLYLHSADSISDIISGMYSDSFTNTLNMSSVSLTTTSELLSVSTASMTEMFSTTLDITTSSAPLDITQAMSSVSLDITYGISSASSVLIQEMSSASFASRSEVQSDSFASTIGVSIASSASFSVLPEISSDASSTNTQELSSASFSSTFGISSVLFSETTEMPSASFTSSLEMSSVSFSRLLETSSGSILNPQETPSVSYSIPFEMSGVSFTSSLGLFGSSNSFTGNFIPSTSITVTRSSFLSTIQNDETFTISNAISPSTSLVSNNVFSSSSFTYTSSLLEISREMSTEITPTIKSILYSTLYSPSIVSTPDTTTPVILTSSDFKSSSNGISSTLSPYTIAAYSTESFIPTLQQPSIVSTIATTTPVILESSDFKSSSNGISSTLSPYTIADYSTETFFPTLTSIETMSTKDFSVTMVSYTTHYFTTQSTGSAFLPNSSPYPSGFSVTSMPLDATTTLSNTAYLSFSSNTLNSAFISVSSNTMIANTTVLISPSTSILGTASFTMSSVMTSTTTPDRPDVTSGPPPKPTTPNITGSGENLWVKTVLTARLNTNISGPGFRTDLEERLAVAYDEAFRRERLIQLGLFDKLRRKRYSESGDTAVHIHDITRVGDSTSVNVLYAVEKSGTILTPEEASTSLNVLDTQELAIILRQVVKTVAEPYQSSSRPVDPEESGIPLWLVGVIAASVAAIIIAAWLAVCIYIKCCREKKQEKRGEPELMSIQQNEVPRGSGRSHSDSAGMGTSAQSDQQRQAGKNNLKKFTPYQVKPADKEALVENVSERDTSGYENEVMTQSSYQDAQHSPKAKSAARLDGRASNHSLSYKPDMEHTTPTKMGTKIASKSNDGDRYYPAVVYTDDHVSPSKPKLNKYQVLQSSFSDQDNEELRERTRQERLKNKERIRIKKRKHRPQVNDPSSSLYNAMGMPSTPVPSLQIESGRPLQEDSHTTMLAKDLTTLPNACAPGEESLEEARTRMHRLLDDAFTLISPRASFAPETAPSPKEPKPKYHAEPSESGALKESGYENPAYSHPGLETWSPYRTSDLVAMISMPTKQEPTRLGQKPKSAAHPISSAKPNRRPAASFEFKETKSATMLDESRLTTSPARPIQLRNRDRSESGTRLTNGNSQHGRATVMVSPLPKVNTSEQFEMNSLKTSRHGSAHRNSRTVPGVDGRTEDVQGTTADVHPSSGSFIQNLRDELSDLKDMYKVAPTHGHRKKNRKHSEAV